MSGTEYLTLAARAVKAEPPAAFRAVRDKLRALIAAERYQPATPSLAAALYHLVDRNDVERYRSVSAGLTTASPTLRVSGPFAPFAFAPDLL